MRKRPPAPPHPSTNTQTHMDITSMDSTLVNWSALDSLVLDYAEAEGLVAQSQHMPGDYKLRSTISHIRGLIERGHVTQALDCIQEHAPSVLNDHRLLFRLHKQRFIELLRSGDVDAQNQAIQCCRTILGPCALDAYPEAYEEFKRLLLALVYNKDDEHSPVFEEWSEARRAMLAATVASVLRADLHAYDPLFSLSLRYLVSTHNSHCFRQGVKSPIANAAETLLRKEKDPPATPRDYLLEAPNFQESDVQALAHAVDLQRQGAVDSLRYTNGDLVTAFKNEISRIRVDTSFLDELVHDYCVYRGLVDCYASSSPSMDCHSSVTVPEIGDEVGSSEGTKENIPAETMVELKCEVREETMQEACIPDQGTGDLEATMEEHLDSISDHSAGEPTQAESGNASESFCSTSGSRHHHDYVGLLKQKHARSNAPRRRWRGRETLSSEKRPLDDGGQYALHLLEHSKGSCKIKNISEHCESEKYSITVEIRELACDGMIDEVIQEVKRLNSKFFEHNPHLLFQLKQVEFLKLVKRGSYGEALRIAQMDMGPLAATYRDLLKPLKETVLALAQPPEDASWKPSSPSLLAATLQDALGASLGISEPLLMKIMRATLYTHTDWFKLQMCADPFENILKINDLKNADSACPRSLCHSLTSEANNVMTSILLDSKLTARSLDGSSPQRLDSTRDGALFDDSSILTVMEWMALPRGDAIQLLMQYDGNVESVFEHILP